VKGYDLEVKEQAIELVKSGKSFTEAGKATGVSRIIVINWCNQNGLPSFSGIPRERQKALILAWAGKTATEISREINKNDSTIKRWCDEAGITLVKRNR